MTGMERLLGFYNTSPADSMQGAIVRNILVHVKEVGNLTIFDLADLCFTSPASISRLVRKLGYKSYAYFQKDMVDCIKEYDVHNRFVSMETKPEDQPISEYFLDSFDLIYRQFRESIDYDRIHELTKAMHEAEKVAIYSYSAYFTELFLQSDLFMSGKICDVHSQEKDIHEHVKVLTKKDFVILIAPTAVGSDRREKLIEEIHESGAKVCLINDSRHRAKNSKADIAFPMPNVKQAVDMFIMQLFLAIVDMEYRKEYIDDAGH